MGDVVLSAGVRQNLLSLQKTADLMATTQNRLATGKKVNSALDNPTNFFTSASLKARAGDLSALLDAMMTGIKTLEAADNGLTALTKIVETMQSIVRQARQDSTQSIDPGTPTVFTNVPFNTSNVLNRQIVFDLGGGVSVAVDSFTPGNPTVSTTTGVGVADWTVDLSGSVLTIDDGPGGAAGPVTVDVTALDNTLALKIAAINADLAAAGSNVRAEEFNGQLRFVNSSGEQITVGGAGAADWGFSAANNNLTSTDGSPLRALTEQELADAINRNANLIGKVRASIDANGDLSLENLTATDITITGATATAITGNPLDSTTLEAGTVTGNSTVRQSLQHQFNDLKTQLDRLAEDASFNGVNLLAGDMLKLVFNESGTSDVEIQGKKPDNTPFGPINVQTLGIDGTYDFGNDTDLDTLLAALSAAMTTLRAQSAQYGSVLTLAMNRQEFTKAMINTLEVGADALVLADTNEEGANMLALQTRQQLSSTALSLSAQADQAVLRLFG